MMGSRSEGTAMGMGERTRERMLMSTRTIFRDVRERMTAQVDTVTNMIRDGASAAVVKAAFQEWRQLHEELFDVEREMYRYTHESEREAHRQGMCKLNDEFSEFCRDVKTYLSSPSSPSTPMESVYQETVKETQRLTEEIMRVQSQLRESISAMNTRSFQTRSSVSATSLDPNARPFQPSSWTASTPQGEAHVTGSPRDVDLMADNRTNSNNVGGSGDGRTMAPPNLHAMYRQPPPLYQPPIDPSLAVLEKLADVLDKRDDRLPALQPPVFSGDILAFPSWWNSFTIAIERKAKSEQEKLHFLGQYTSGKAHDSIRFYLDMCDRQDSYSEAKATLFHRFGDKIQISDAFRKRLDAWPPVRKGDAEGLVKFSDFLNQTLSAMDSMSYLSSLNSREENRKLAAKLPIGLAERWDRVVDRWIYGGGTASLHPPAQSRDYPPFAEFCAFVAGEARVAKSSCVYRGQTTDTGRGETRPNPRPAQTSRPQHHKVAMATEVRRPVSAQGARPRQDTRKCLYCDKAHATVNCYKFKNSSVNERKDWARSRNLCFGCLTPGHRYVQCRNKDPALFREPEPQNPNATLPAVPSDKGPAQAATAVNMHTGLGGSEFAAMIVIVDVYHVREPDVVFRVCAALDSQSDSCFISTRLAENLGLEGRPVKLDIKCLGRRCISDSEAVDDLRVSAVDGEKHVHLPQCYTRSYIPWGGRRLPEAGELFAWSHLEGLAKEWPETEHMRDISLLIGFNVPEVFIPGPVLRGDDKDPFAVLTVLGWTVMGNLTQPARYDTKICYKTQAKEITPADIGQAFDLDFTGTSSGQKMSANDVKFLQIMREGLVTLPSGRLELPLPFRDPPGELPCNRYYAVRRLMSLKRKFEKKADYHRKYRDFMQDLFAKGHARKVKISELTNPKSWYLAHQGVEREDKPDMVRVVFDPTPEFEGVCLNALLLCGPDMMNNLVGVVIRFRLEPIGFGCDVKGMFLQFKVSEFFQNYQRFLWFEDGSLDGGIIDCQMTSHIFGATSSPGVANYAMKYLAEKFREQYGDNVANFIRDDFYVDDGLGSQPDVESARAILMGSRALLSEACLDLLKFTSNSRELLERLPPQVRAPELQDPVNELLPLPTGHSLGCGWDKERDELVFVRKILKASPTRRSMLSMLSGIYDPMGFIGPVILPGRRILQRLCRMQLMWDDPVDRETFDEWQRWESDLESLDKVRIARCMRKTASLPITARELHSFSDASTQGFGACSYLVNRSASGTDSSLVIGKSKVPPTKQVTIPRLELQAAVLAVKIAVFVEEELKMTDVQLFFWTDSIIVLGYITNDSKRFHLFVRNRVQIIRELSAVSQWRHVATDQNPADLASRGCTVSELMATDLWLQGPEFLRQPIPAEIDAAVLQDALSEDDPEIVKVSSMVTETAPTSYNPVSEMLARVSSWPVMVATLAVWRRWLRKLMVRIGKSDTPAQDGPLTVLERREARDFVIALIQSESYPELFSERDRDDEGRDLRVPKRSPLYKLDAFRSADGTLHVGGRLLNSDLPRDMAQPQILPSKHHVTKAVVRHIHHLQAHCGRAYTVNALRSSGYWVCGVRKVVGSVIGRCVVCQKYRGQRLHQKMSDLPPERVNESAPFTYCGVDCFGPMMVKQK